MRAWGIRSAVGICSRCFVLPVVLGAAFAMSRYLSSLITGENSRNYKRRFPDATIPDFFAPTPSMRQAVAPSPRLAIMARPAHRLQVRPHRSQRIIWPIEWLDVIHVYCHRIVAHLTHRTLSPLHQTYSLPLAAIASLLFRASRLLTLYLAFFG